ncbi:MAG: lipoate--protein ligase family protein [Planctomycetes bacterium]|nr:lipoate--protein ligase family protein [Planctomycetota bacterium]
MPASRARQHISPVAAVDYLDLTLPSLEENLALDEALLLVAEQHGQSRGEVLRFWESPQYAVILGSACRMAQDVQIECCRRDGIPVLRRASGGGTVIIGPGCLNITLILRYDRCAALGAVAASYGYILERILSALEAVAPDAGWHCQGTGDLCIGQRKVGGSAQRRMRSAMLYHGTLLYGFFLEQVPRYLTEPARRPAYRRQRPHESFLTNCDVPAAAAFKAQMQQRWDAFARLLRWPQDMVHQLVAEKYSNPRWINRL